MILRQETIQSYEAEIEHYVQRAAECEKYGDNFGAEHNLELARFILENKIKPLEGA